jgi:putative transposase
LKTYLPAAKLPGRLRAHSLRDIFDAIFYILRSGCPWRMLPGDFPPWPTVYYHFRKCQLSGLWQRIFAILRTVERERVGKNPNPSAAIMDSQSIKTTQEGSRSNGYDAHKDIKGRKRHLLWTLWAHRSRFTSRPQTYRIESERAFCSPG